jgi:hypothetical protein
MAEQTLALLDHFAHLEDGLQNGLVCKNGLQNGVHGPVCNIRRTQSNSR